MTHQEYIAIEKFAHELIDHFEHKALPKIPDGESSLTLKYVCKIIEIQLQLAKVKFDLEAEEMKRKLLTK